MASFVKAAVPVQQHVPNKAITLIHFDDRELVAEIIGLLTMESLPELIN